MHAPTHILLAALLLICASSEAQIYTCIGKDGSRVFSDERCGPDAKVVEGYSKTKRQQSKGAAAKPVRTRLSADELERLTIECDAGDMKACTAWTMGGGPELLRDQERKNEVECEAGSLAACEERYCRDGMNASCRDRVLRTAPLAGDTWYLRNEMREAGSGTTQYVVRCTNEDARDFRDVIVTCSSEAGPNRCYGADAQRGFPRLAAAAASHCSRRTASSRSN